MLDELIQNNYKSLKDKAMQSGSNFTANKQLIEDLFHNVLISMLNNPKLCNITLDSVKGYIYRSIKNNCIREFKYARNRKMVNKQNLEDV